MDVPQNYFDLHFETVNDVGFELDALQARRKKEFESLTHLREMAHRIKTMRQMHEWLFTEHRAYSVSVTPQRAIGAVLKTY